MPPAIKGANRPSAFSRTASFVRLPLCTASDRLRWVNDRSTKSTHFQPVGQSHQGSMNYSGPESLVYLIYRVCWWLADAPGKIRRNQPVSGPANVLT